nr:DUF1203 domain-containing protein [Kineosporia rhizophila]
MASGDGPCRVCLNPFRSGVDRAVWFVYDPVRGRGPVPAPGPVQVHEDGCCAYENAAAGLDPAVFTDDLSVLLQGFPVQPDDTAAVTGIECATGAPAVGKALQHLFADPAVAFVHVRRADDGCFLCEVTTSGH